MHGYLALVLHAHLPFVRHPEHDRFLEENWLFEAMTETYLPLLRVLDGWERDGVRVRLTLTLSPTLCAMLLDPLLQGRFQRQLDALIDLAEREVHRTHWDPALQPLARLYHDRFRQLRDQYAACGRNLVGAFRKFQDAGRLEIITTAATHAVLPLLAPHQPAIRAQVLVARDHYRSCFEREPRGFWLPECAYAPEVEPALREAGVQWFILETHGLLHARPRPRFGVSAPVQTTSGLAAFARDAESAKQVWSREHGYPGDSRYRDFYRDIGFDLDYDYVRALMPVNGARTFTGIKYHAIAGGTDKQLYDPRAAQQAVAEHAAHFIQARHQHVQSLAGVMDRPPLLVCPYDAELFGHWWFEGPEFLDQIVRAAAASDTLRLITPLEYLERHPAAQTVEPSASTWGEEGHLKVWLNETNAWIYPHLQAAQERMTELATTFPKPDALTGRALRQAGRELLLAQASDWPFILRTGTSPDYARRRVTDHLRRFTVLHEQLTTTRIDKAWLAELEAKDNLFAELDPQCWARSDRAHGRA